MLNGSDLPIDARVELVGYEWGDVGNVRQVAKAIELAPRAFGEVWRDDDDASEINIWFEVVVTAAGETRRLEFNFPKLYLRRALVSIPLVGGQGVVIAAITSQ